MNQIVETSEKSVIPDSISYPRRWLSDLLATKGDDATVYLRPDLTHQPLHRNVFKTKIQKTSRYQVFRSLSINTLYPQEGMIVEKPIIFLQVWDEYEQFSYLLEMVSQKLILRIRRICVHHWHTSLKNFWHPFQSSWSRFAQKLYGFGSEPHSPKYSICLERSDYCHTCTELEIRVKARHKLFSTSEQTNTGIDRPYCSALFAFIIPKLFASTLTTCR